MSLRCETVLLGGRVIDPDTGLDDVRNVGIANGRIVAVTDEPLEAEQMIDVDGLVVAPGFIDLHSHAQNVAGARLQALDGVTTALELEQGVLPVGAAYAEAEREGRPINFGFSAGWAQARFDAIVGERDHDALLIGLLGDARWSGAQPGSLDEIVSGIARGLEEGGLGVGMLLGYAPATESAEFVAVAALAARYGVPVFVHSRHMSMDAPGTSLDAILEIIEVAHTTGASIHVCHLNSTSLRMIEQIRVELLAARGQGVAVTTEAYPYGAGSTGIGADFFAPDRFARLGTPSTSIRYLATGERVVDLERLAQLRQDDPSGLCVWEYLDVDRADDRRLLLASLTMPGGVIASDAMPLAFPGGRQDTLAWPVPDGARAHPRGAGTFARTLRWLVREAAVFDLPEAIRRMSLGPAQILEGAVPQMRRKGRVQVGADADLAVFDAATVTDTATFDRISPSEGMRHLLVAGRRVVRDGVLDPAANPGAAIRRTL